MRRHFFKGLGIYLVILGLECFAVDEFIMTSADERLTGPLSGYHYLTQRYGDDVEVPEHLRRRYRTKEWAPWSLCGGGAVVFIYASMLYQGGGAAAGKH
jgi:hypothetical protein